MASDRPVGVERLLFLRTLSIGSLDGPEAVQIASAMRDVYFKRGQEIFAVGDPSGDVFFVVKGSVRMSAPDAPPWDFDAPAVVGALDSFAGRPRGRRGVATTDVHALALAHTDWLAVLEEHHEYACASVLRLSGGLARMRLGLGEGGGHPAVTPPDGVPPTGLSLFEKAVALRRHPLFLSAGVEATLRLVDLSHEIDLSADEVLFREGAPSDALFVVAGGAIAATRAAPPLRAAFGPGALVGGAAALGEAQHAFEARASQAAVVLRLRKDDVLDVMEDHFDLTRSLLTCINGEREEIMRRHGTSGDPLAEAAPASRPAPSGVSR